MIHVTRAPASAAMVTIPVPQPASWQVRATPALCTTCRGKRRIEHHEEDDDTSRWWEERCEDCVGTGLDPIPRAEVMRGYR